MSELLGIAIAFGCIPNRNEAETTAGTTKADPLRVGARTRRAPHGLRHSPTPECTIPSAAGRAHGGRSPITYDRDDGDDRVQGAPATVAERPRSAT